MRPLVWFRADLRTADNTALSNATRDATKGALGVFLVAHDQWAEHDWAPIKVDFILRTLRELSDRLDELGIPLLIREAPRFDDAPRVLLDIADEHECDALYFNEEYAVNERSRDEAVTSACEGAGRTVRNFTDFTVLPPGSVLTKDEGYYSVFSPFKRRFYAVLEEERGGIWTEPPARKQTPLPGITRDDIPNQVKGFEADKHTRDAWAERWHAGEKPAQGILGSFARDRIDAYKDERDFPAIDATSVLSPHLTVGSISPRQCIRSALDQNSGRLDKGKKGPVHWISEVVWREFYQHLLVGYPRVSKGRPFQLHTDELEWADNDEHFEAWKAGRTGVPIVDAGMRQLNEIGWMHNRLRMITAMFLTKNLFIDWRRGERYFMQHLIDGELGSNNGGWQWSASTGTDAAPYFRIMNPVSQSKRFDPEGDFIRRYVPELDALDGKTIHEPANSGLAFASVDYPEPIVDLKSSRQAAIDKFQALKDDN